MANKIESNSQGRKERRYLPRWEVKSRVRYSKSEADTPLEGESKDLNYKGISLWTSGEFLPNERLQITVFLAEDTSFTLPATVLWAKKSDDRNLIGLQFENTSNEVRDLIFNFAFEHNRDELVKRWFEGF